MDFAVLDRSATKEGERCRVTANRNEAVSKSYASELFIVNEKCTLITQV
jgi:hypothetical protein